MFISKHILTCPIYLCFPIFERKTVTLIKLIYTTLLLFTWESDIWFKCLKHSNKFSSRCLRICFFFLTSLFFYGIPKTICYNRTINILSEENQLFSWVYQNLVIIMTQYCVSILFRFLWHGWKDILGQIVHSS